MRSELELKYSVGLQIILATGPTLALLIGLAEPQRRGKHFGRSQSPWGQLCPEDMPELVEHRWALKKCIMPLLAKNLQNIFF